MKTRFLMQNGQNGRRKHKVVVTTFTLYLVRRKLRERWGREMKGERKE